MYTLVNNLNVAWILSPFFFSHSGKVYQCVLVHWFLTFGHEPNPDTGIWAVMPDYDGHGYHNMSVTHVMWCTSIPNFYHVEASRLLNYTQSLDYPCTFYMNNHPNSHASKLIQ